MKVLDYEGLKLVIDRLKYLITDSIDKHENDTNIHVTTEDRAKWDAVSNVENQLNNLDKKVETNMAVMAAKIKRLESAMFEDITGNPFSITFKDINGLVLTNGVFNQNKARLEC